MMTGKQVQSNLYNLYSELSKFGHAGEFERALKTANKILQQSPDEEEAAHCRIVCQIHLSKFGEALSGINKNANLERKLVFEKAYCLYRLNRVRDALATIDDSTKGSLPPKLKELRAQILYRLEEYPECYDLYKEIVKTTSDEYEDERESNMAAAVVGIALGQPEKEVPACRDHTFELVYNQGCLLAARESYLEAERKLKHAEKMCREFLEEEGTTDEDVEAEVGIIKCQTAYCIQQQGRDKEAGIIYNEILRSKPSDAALVAVASNNSAVLNRDQNVFDSKKKIKAATVDGLEHKLTSFQQKIIAVNQALLTIYTGQSELTRELLLKLAKKWPELNASCILLKAAQLARDSKSEEAVGLLESAKITNLKEMLEIRLTAVQLLLQMSQRRRAVQILEQLLEPAGYPAGLLAALVTLILADKESAGKAAQVLQRAVDRGAKTTAGNTAIIAVWRQTAQLSLRAGDAAGAARSLEQLLAADPNDANTAAQLVLAYCAAGETQKAKLLTAKLPRRAAATLAQDVDALETSNWMMGTKGLRKVGKSDVTPKSPGGEELIVKKKSKNRKRKSKLPKNYKPGTVPDPERWLPKHERTGYRKKRDRRVKDAPMKGSQGAASAQADLYDMSKMTHKNSPNSPAPDSIRQQQQKKVQSKQKRKKGKH